MTPAQMQEAKKRKGLTYRELAATTGVAINALHACITGKRDSRRSTIERVAKVLGEE